VVDSLKRSWNSSPATLSAGAVDYSWAVTGQQLRVTYSQPATDSTVIPPGGILTLVYHGSLTATVGAGASLVNYAAAFFSSQPTSGPTYQRTYEGTNAAQPNTWHDARTITVPSATAVKAFGSTLTTATIGQAVPYRITVTLPAKTTLYNGVLTDFVPNGLTVTTTSTEPSTGTVSVGAKGADGRTPVTWNVGDVSNPPTATISLLVTATVDSTYALGGMP